MFLVKRKMSTWAYRGTTRGADSGNYSYLAKMHVFFAIRRDLKQEESSGHGDVISVPGSSFGYSTHNAKLI